MIPPFDENGYLPPGIHRATIGEIEERFGRTSEIRAELVQSLRRLLDMIRLEDVRKLIVNGSFVTSKLEPRDVDCYILIGPTFGLGAMAEHEWKAPLPYIHLEYGDEVILSEYTQHVFAMDGQMHPKGMIEVIL